MNYPRLGGGRHIPSALGTPPRFRSKATVRSTCGDMGKLDSSDSPGGGRTRDVINTQVSLAVLVLLALLLGLLTTLMPEQQAEITSSTRTGSTIAVPEYPNVLPTSIHQWNGS